MTCLSSSSDVGRHLNGISSCRPLLGRRAGWVLLRTTAPRRSSTSTVPLAPQLATPVNAEGRRSAGAANSFSSAGTTIVERRAADVAVLGDSCVAFAAAYSLARRGKKVVLLPDMGFSAPRPTLEVFRPLHLPHPDSNMVSISADAAAYWRGLQAQAAAGSSGRQVLAQCRSLDVGPMRRATGGAGGVGAAALEQMFEVEEVLGRLQEACKAAGVRLGSLRGEELSGLFPPLRMSGEEAGLLQPEGGVLNSSEASDLLRNLGEREGVLLRERLVLRGWRDAGSHFALRASGALMPGAVSVFEVERVLLAPQNWPRHALRLFGVDAEQLKVVRSIFGRCSGTTELSSLPVWRLFSTCTALAPTTNSTAVTSSGSGKRSSTEAAEQLTVVRGFPARLDAPASSSASLKLSVDMSYLRQAANAAQTLDCDPWNWHPSTPDGEGLLLAQRQASRLLRGIGPLRRSQSQITPSPETSPATSSITRRLGTSPAAAGVGPGHAATAALELYRDVGLHTATSDGWPVLGSLPGFEPGRFLFACVTSSCCDVDGVDGGGGGSGSSSRSSIIVSNAVASANAAGRPGTDSGDMIRPAGSSGGEDLQGRNPRQQQQQKGQGGWRFGGRPVLHDGYQLSPLLAKMAVDLMCGAARPAEVDLERVDLNRPAMAAHVVTHGSSFDPWDGLARWQDGSAFREEVAAAHNGGMDVAEARERAEAVARGAKMSGGDVGWGEEAVMAREGAERGRVQKGAL